MPPTNYPLLRPGPKSELPFAFAYRHLSVKVVCDHEPGRSIGIGALGANTPSTLPLNSLPGQSHQIKDPVDTTRAQIHEKLEGNSRKGVRWPFIRSVQSCWTMNPYVIVNLERTRVLAAEKP
jgi:hypothetical protein